MNNAKQNKQLQVSNVKLSQFSTYKKNDSIINDFEIDMSSHVVKGMQYKSFFGLHGGLPLAYTERIMFNAKLDNVFRFFDEIFAEFITQHEQRYYKIVHSYIKLFKSRYKTKNNCYKKILINSKYNNIGQTRLSMFLLGKYGIIQSYTNRNSFILGENSINSIKNIINQKSDEFKLNFTD